MSLTPSELRKHLKGIFAFPVTPFKKNQNIDYDKYRAILDFMLRHKIDKIMPCGANGELYALSPDEYLRMIKHTVEEVRGRALVIPGIGFTPQIAIELLPKLEALRVDGTLLLAPYFIAPGPEGLLNYYKKVSQATRLGIIIYNTEQTYIQLQIVPQLLKIKNIVGIKQEMGNLAHFRELSVMAENRWAMICGMAEIMAAPFFSLGAVGYTSGITNYTPNTSRKIYQALVSGEYQKVESLVRKYVLPVYRIRHRRPGYLATVIKECMNYFGADIGTVRPPSTPILLKDKRELHTALRKMNLPKISL